MEDIKEWAGLVAVLIAVGSVVWGWLTAGDKKSIEGQGKRLGEFTTALTEADRRLSGVLSTHEKRIQSLEGKLEHLPDNDQAHNLELAIERLTGRIDVLDERLKPVAAISDRLQEFLLEQARPSR